MDPFFIVWLPGILGGLVLAFVLFRLHRQDPPMGADCAFRDEPF